MAATGALNLTARAIIDASLYLVLATADRVALAVRLNRCWIPGREEQHGYDVYARGGLAGRLHRR